MEVSCGQVHASPPPPPHRRPPTTHEPTSHSRSLKAEELGLLCVIGLVPALLPPAAPLRLQVQRLWRARLCGLGLGRGLLRSRASARMRACVRACVRVCVSARGEHGTARCQHQGAAAGAAPASHLLQQRTTKGAADRDAPTASCDNRRNLRQPRPPLSAARGPCPPGTPPAVPCVVQCWPRAQAHTGTGRLPPAATRTA
jgi:hypothetical protein